MNHIKNFFKYGRINKILIFGLGNPGKKYNLSRHNIGRMTINFLAKSNDCQYKYYKKFKAFLAETTINNKEIILAKSENAMNISGEPIRLIKDYYKISSENIWIIHDDVDIAFGKIKVSQEKGAAGHHGVESVINHLKSNQFNRIRIGIWNRPFEEKNKNITQSYVMKNFNQEEQEKLNEIKKEVVSLIGTAIKE